jgi:hypothetical protein
MIDFWFTGFVLIVALLLAVGVSLLFVGYINTLPASFSFGWRCWAPTLLLPLLGPLAFAWCHPAEFSRPAKQLLAGILLLGMAVGLLYGGGPYLVDHMALGAR